MLYDLRMAMIVTRREVRDQFRDWRIITPIILLTLFFPALMNFTASQAVAFVQRYGADLIGERLIPFLLMVVGFFPISISLVIALESFVGEKERRSIEPLLSSPLSDLQLYVGKLLASMVPPLIAAYLGIAVYVIGLNLRIGYKPDVTLLILIVLLTSVQAVVMVSAAVVISTQTTSTRAANLLASFVIIPMALLIQAESIIMFWGRYSALWLIIAALILISTLLIRAGISHFNREDLLGRELDTLNLLWIKETFKNRFFNGTDSFRSSFRIQYQNLLTDLGSPMVIASITLIGALIIGVFLAGWFILPVEGVQIENLNDGVLQGLGTLPIYSISGVITIWFHNLRAIFLATLLGVFTFGVLGILVLMLPITMIGYFMATIAGIGLSPILFFSAFVLPHGILEIPAMIIAGAAILRLGATLSAPSNGKTIGAAFIIAFADWVKVLIFLVAPLLLGAAFLEIYLTPTVVAQLLGG